MRIVRDFMLTLDEYAVVTETATLLEALNKLEASQKQLSGGRHPHRAVLVKNDEGQIIGKVGHLAFLKALEPRYDKLGEIGGGETLGGMSKSFVNSIMGDLTLWEQGLSSYVARAQEIKVRDVMHPVTTEHIEANAPLREAIHKLVEYQTLSLLVTSADRIVGVLRLSDVFHVLSKFITKKSQTS
jgi:CBS domain-containing protein